MFHQSLVSHQQNKFHHHCWCMVQVCSVYWCTLVLVTIRPLLVILWYATLHIVNFLSGDFTLTSFGHTTNYNNLLFVTFLHHLGLCWSTSGLKNKLYHIQFTCLSYICLFYVFPMNVSVISFQELHFRKTIYILVL